ncbi:TPR repeat region-containing protein [Gordonia sp. GN26]
MNRPTRSTVNSWDVMVLLQSAESLETTAENLRTQTKTMADAPMNVEGWSGESKRACEDRTTSDQDEINRLGTELSAAARVLHDTAAAISPNRSTALTKALGLELDKFSVSDDWTVRDARDYASELNGVEAGSAAEQSIRNDQAKRAEEAKTATLSLQSLADQIGEDDRNGARALNVVLGNAEINAPLSSSFSAGQASRDVQAIMSGTATPEQKERFYRATSLTPEQRAALARGEEAVISKEQFDYLKAIYTPNWGQSSEGSAPYALDALKRFGDEYSGAERLQLKNALGDGIYLLGNPSVRTDQQVEQTFLAGPLQQMGLTPGPRFVTGGLNELSAPVRDTLTKPSATKANYVDPYADRGEQRVYTAAKLSSFADMQDLMDVLEYRSRDSGPAGYGDGSVQLGSDVDRALISRASEIAAGDSREVYMSDEDTRLSHSEVEKLLTRMMDVAGSDHIAVHDAVVRTGSSVDVDAGMPDVHDLDGGSRSYDASIAMKDLFQFDWKDGVGDESNGVNRLFNWMPEVANTPEGLSAERTLDGVRSGEVASELARIIAENKSAFEDMNGGSESLGQTNPELTRTLAKAMSPYLADLAGADPDLFETRGVIGLEEGAQFNALFQVLDSAPEAGRIMNASALWQANVLEQAFGYDSSRTELGELAGRLHGGMTAGMNHMLDEDEADRQYAAAVDYVEKGAVYDSAAAVGSLTAGLMGSAVPGLGPALQGMVDVSAPSLKLGILGSPPNSDDIGASPDFDAIRAEMYKSTNLSNVYQGMLDGYLRANPDFVQSADMREIYGDKIDDPKFVESVRRDGLPSTSNQTAITKLVKELFGSRDNDFIDSYTNQLDRLKDPHGFPDGGKW